MPWKFLNRSTLILVIVGLVASIPGTAFADAEDLQADRVKAEKIISDLLITDDSGLAYANLADADRQLVDDYNRIHDWSETLTEREVTLSNTCLQRTATVTGVNVFGATLLTFSNTVNWCHDGSSFVGHPTHWQNIWTAPFWTYNGLVDDWHIGGVGYNGIEMRHMGEFQLCYTSWGCIDSRYPWIHQWAMANGDYFVNTGG